MTDTLAVTVYSSCLTLALAVAGAVAFSWGAPQASAALFAAAGCTVLSSIATALIIASANAARTRARARHPEDYAEDTKPTRT